MWKTAKCNVSSRENYFEKRNPQEHWNMFVCIQLLCFLNEALKCYTNKIEIEMEFFLCLCN